MITNPAVFILGAGASRGYGYPTGRQLMSALTSIDGDQLLELETVGGDAKNTMQFQQQLAGCGLNSVDTFLRKNPQFAVTAKVRIAQVLSAAERKAAAGVGREDTWVQYLFANFLDGNCLEAFSDNKCTFVTLNYDRSLEFELTKMLRNTYSVDWKVAADRVRTLKIIHLHGSIAPLPDHEVLYGSPFGPIEMRAAVKSILTLGEVGSEREYEAAAECISAAAVIFCLGFGYHHETIEKLGIRKAPTPAVYGSCQGLTQSEVNNVSRQLAPRHFSELLRDGVTWNAKPREPGPAVDYLRASVELIT